MTFPRTKIPEMTRKNFSDGGNVDEKWNTIIQNGELERVYREAGIRGVMSFTGLQKSQSYLLVAEVGLNRQIVKERVAKKAREIKQRVLTGRLKHAKDTWDWTPGQEFIYLKGRVYSYEQPIKVGELTLLGGKPYCIAPLPGRLVLDFMVEKGLKFFIIQHKVLSVQKMVGRRNAIVQVG